ncbi:hypothetical protein CDAR_198571 [Caerostris darwini]|uniref:Uncharacterized protein n=1 Tax=Caerostris darwini TaxID=1538125 RepID=A0AAV4W5M3_9ARAC|nr:hypothetical protein CDAR_198571 [Caerostris darwini]
MSREIGHWMVVKGREETRNGANRSLSVLLQLIRGLERDASEDRYLGHGEWTAPNPSDKSGLCCQKLGQKQVTCTRRRTEKDKAGAAEVTSRPMSRRSAANIR